MKKEEERTRKKGEGRMFNLLNDIQKRMFNGKKIFKFIYS